MKTTPAAFKQTLLRRMLFGLRLSAPAASLALQERKAAVRLAADAAMASARGAGRRWTRALASRLLDQDRRRRSSSSSSSRQSFLQFVLGRQFVRLAKPPPPRSKKIVRRSLAMCSAAARRKRNGEEEAKRRRRSRSTSLVEKRTRALKRLVPGGVAMDGLSLLDESLDYAVALRTQVELMQSLLTTLEASKLRARNGYCTILPERKASFVGK